HPPKTEYTPDQKLTQSAQKFFDLISDRKKFPLSDDDILSYHNLVKNHPELRDEPFFKEVLNPDLYRTKPDDALLKMRMKVAHLIADGKIDVSGVPPIFADKYLFGKQALGLFDLSQDFHLKDFVGGSVVDKAKQYVAIDKVSRMVYETTKSSFEKMENRLQEWADEPELGPRLKGLETQLKPYHKLLKGIEEAEEKGDDKLAQAMVKANTIQLRAMLDQDLRQLAPNMSAKDREKAVNDKLEFLTTAFRLVEEYGTDGPVAAAKMRSNVAELKKTAIELGISTGDYEQDQISFRKKAFSLLNDSSMDLLHQAYQQGLEKLGPDAKAVVAKAKSLEGEIATTKAALKFAAKIAGSLVPGGLVVIEGADLAIKAGKHYQHGKMVDMVRRSPEAQRHERDELILEAALTIALLGYEHAAHAAEAAHISQGVKNFAKLSPAAQHHIAEEALAKSAKELGKEVLKGRALDIAKEKLIHHMMGEAEHAEQGGAAHGEEH
ncbi:MAG: hypothetical protein ACAI44_32070, partial [Candidatus Sericytochromatia bacterium]